MEDEISVEEQIERLEGSITEQRRMIKMGEALDRLFNNPDFDAIITQDLMKDEAIRLVHMEAEPGFLVDEVQQREVAGQRTAIAFLRRHFMSIMRMSETAKQELVHAESYIDELRGMTHDAPAFNEGEGA